MALLDIHVELARTNDLLARIADALDRAVPAVEVADHSKHPLIGLADISHFTPSTDRDTMSAAHAATPPRSFDSTERPGRPGVLRQPDDPLQQHQSPNGPSVTGAWDHEDPLDALEDLADEWPNYSGVDT